MTSCHYHQQNLTRSRSNHIRNLSFSEKNTSIRAYLYKFGTVTIPPLHEIR